MGRSSDRCRVPSADRPSFEDWLSRTKSGDRTHLSQTFRLFSITVAGQCRNLTDFAGSCTTPLSRRVGHRSRTLTTLRSKRGSLELREECDEAVDAFFDVGITECEGEA